MNWDRDLLLDAIKKHDTPVFVYDSNFLIKQAKSLVKLCPKDQITVRYAIKANPHVGIIKLFNDCGLEFDASSDYEVDIIQNAGIEPAKISLSSQQPPRDILETLNSGIKFVATSLHQLDLIKKSGWKGKIAVRINPGIGSGHNNRTATGGPNASFGIWHEYLNKILAWEQLSGCAIDRLHIHVGSGTDPEAWQEIINLALKLVKQMAGVTILDIGGGYKIARMPDEKAIDATAVISIFTRTLEDFKNQTGRSVHLEIEPGTWLVGNAGVLLAEVIDVVDTGADGHTFLRLNTGMNDLLRPSLYGAQHPITVLNNVAVQQSYVVVGHNCESGDILTPADSNPEQIKPRQLNRASIGDIVAIGGAGAYAASMSAKGYNSYPSATEILI